MDRRDFFRSVWLGAASLRLAAGADIARAVSGARGQPPNIVFVMADDMGYGDVGCYNPESKIPTPNMDRLAREGIRFTDAHSPSAVCTPTRYGVLTGRYCWRTPLKSQVLYGYEPPLIERNRLTVASLLKKNGYETACIGKWHLGLEWAVKPGSDIDFSKPLPWKESENLTATGKDRFIDFTQDIEGGPVDLGFDYAFYTSGCSTVQPPYCFIEGKRTVGIPSERIDVEKMQARPGWMVPGWRQEDVDPTFTNKAVEFIEKHQTDRADSPFFLYFGLSAPHAPWLPPDFVKGKSSAGLRGDMVVLADWCVGKVLDALDRFNLSDDTLVIVTSDNGPRIGTHGARIVNNHRSSGRYRGYKSHIWEGGHRVPFIARWPGRIAPGTTSDELIGLTDLMATCAAIVGAALPENAAEDSFNILPALLGEHRDRPIRDSIIHHSCWGVFAIRQGRWKLVLDTQGSGGWVKPADDHPTEGSPGQLYDMADDPYETTNLWDAHPEIVARLKRLLDRQKKAGRSRPMRG